MHKFLKKRQESLQKVTQISPFLVIVQSQLLVSFFHFSENVFQESIDSFLPYDSSSFIKLDYYFGPFVECLSRQPSLVINIVGTDDISRLPRLVTGFTNVGWMGVGGGGQINGQEG